MTKLLAKNETLSLKAEVKGGAKSVVISVPFVNKGYTCLFNAQHIFLELEKFQRCFFDFLCEKMNLDNTVLIDGDLKSEFVLFLSKITGGKKTLTTRTVTNYVKILIDSKLLIEAPKLNMLYIVNPKYVYKGTKKDRIKILKTLLKCPNKYGSDNSALLNRPKSLILKTMS
jgi:hypothetical protein